MKKDRILFLLHLPPPIHGASMIGEYIKNSELINQEFICEFMSISTARSLEEVGHHKLDKVTAVFKIYYSIFNALVKNRYDLCYLTINSKGLAFFKEMVIVFLCKLFNCNIVYHYHNQGVAKANKKIIYNLLYRYQFKNSRALMLSPLLYADIAKYLPESRISYCSNGIPVDKTIDLEDLQLRRHQNKIAKLLFLSNLMESKGVYVLLEACKILKSQNINFTITFIGAPMDIDEAKFNEYVLSNNLSDIADYKGKKYGKQKSKYFSSADIFIHPTLDDAFPLVVLEAMQYGLPIVTTNEGSLPEIVENGINGYVVEKEQPLALAKRIEHLIKLPNLRKEIGMANRQKFEKLYTQKQMEKNLANAFHFILEENKITYVKEKARALR